MLLLLSVLFFFLFAFYALPPVAIFPFVDSFSSFSPHSNFSVVGTLDADYFFLFVFSLLMFFIFVILFFFFLALWLFNHYERKQHSNWKNPLPSLGIRVL